MAYVDLNIIRAGLADTPKDSGFHGLEQLSSLRSIRGSVTLSCVAHCPKRKQTAVAITPWGRWQLSLYSFLW
jgi:hypothetical protein